MTVLNGYIRAINPAWVNRALREVVKLVREEMASKLDEDTWRKIDKVKGSPRAKMELIIETLRAEVGIVPRRRSQHSKQRSNRYVAFYNSYAWKKLAYAAKVKSEGRCLACNRTDRPLNADHIKPIRFHWELRLDPDNIQVLCDLCNTGKGSWDETDWRAIRAKQRS